MAFSNNTRKYSGTRLLSLYGYRDDPIVDDTLPSRIPRLTQRTGRLIQLGRRGACEIWSPNSAVHPYLPGVVPKGFDFSIPENSCHRRYDGHLGRFDYTISPQMFSSETPWRGFIRRHLSPQTDDLPEFTPVFQLWKPPTSDPSFLVEQLPPKYVDAISMRISSLQHASAGNNEIALDYREVWENRPVLPTPSEVDRLRSVATYEDAVDLVLDVQRRIRDFDAWHRYVQLSLHDYPPKKEEEFLRSPQSPANDEWIGAWINGAPEIQVLHALYWKMPCFIAHVLSSEELSKLSKNNGPAQSPIDGTDATKLDKLLNGYDYIADRSRRGYTSYAPSSKADLPSMHKPYRVLSAASKHGWCGRWRSDVEDSRKELAIRPPPLLPPLLVQPSTPEVPAPEPLPLDTVVVDIERVPWIRPPPVMPYKQTSKATHWREEVVKGKQGMKEVAAKSKSLQNLSQVYDRVLKRTLHFEERLSRPDGAVFDDKVFGLPAPPLLFCSKYGDMVPPSVWVYRYEKPQPLEVGRRATTPEPSSLPLLSSLSAFPKSMRPYDGDDDGYNSEDNDLQYYLPKYLEGMSPKRTINTTGNPR
jgi:hypothetical protein